MRRSVGRIANEREHTRAVTILFGLFLSIVGVLAVALTATADNADAAPTRAGHVATYSYDSLRQLSSVREARSTSPEDTASQATASDATARDEPRPAAASGVAAEGAGSGVVRHYTTGAAAQSISKEGVLRPGATSGKTWLTPDRYTSGADARAKLALNKTPDGYYEIPMCRVQCPSGPSTVEPFHGQPGGGTEITTEWPIDISDLPFMPFGGG